ncbi:MAG: hypothetical protein COY75_03915 [Nitrospirae bacterium CG_4_10_14_0_8_um_filter_41_23]|nr:MAG: hypothetical protein COV68_08685 [Nitrospirae bacterium CG11_big_fil_rev_8_21_14_0_20_41_14]PIV44341.1 MAG: hypothetical protein COS27_02060 [Nitrospirae bacterium CG02_land_8_20_14_3_00_41_53]PIW87403.1 MAG: hypothetical protein COZ94_05395 [Nitrospirae bacterium CG_4_8_14_3_um_filter_41_47]PIY87217.1 MAG: hypothetical protein COY75_03915 [Nitrospirae bacterium CG_4_10_14_0_8_um_filter_41_23]PJA79543.1 MAG: hypothetical protein CO148_07215 [Nitrospirae bacterium CG_4_9_14_3_um_filter_4
MTVKGNFLTSFLTSNYLIEVRDRGLSIKASGVALPLLPLFSIYPYLDFLMRRSNHGFKVMDI